MPERIRSRGAGRRGANGESAPSLVPSDWFVRCLDATNGKPACGGVQTQDFVVLKARENKASQAETWTRRASWPCCTCMMRVQTLKASTQSEHKTTASFRGHTTAQQNLRGWKADRHLGSRCLFPFAPLVLPRFFCRERKGAQPAALQLRAATTKRRGDGTPRRWIFTKPELGPANSIPCLRCKPGPRTHRDVAQTGSGR